jgi:precorrin-2 dehydrogenase/sirohydrochlorin ferrochelatase
MIPLFCDLADKRVVILGGGRVALRKARRFAPEADLSVHAPELRAGFEKLPCKLVRERVDADRARELLDDAFLAVVATDDAALNGRFTQVAREKGCLVNRTDRPGGEADADTESEASAEPEASETSTRGPDSPGEDPAGDVIVPSTIEAGPITAAITTGGSSPAMAKYLRRRIEPLLEASAPMVRLQGELRAELKRTVEGSAERRERLWAVIESEAVREALAAGEAERARRLARERAGLTDE